MEAHDQTMHCQICGLSGKEQNLYPAEMVRPALAKYIRSKYPAWDGKGYICIDDLNKFRSAYIENVLKTDVRESSHLKKAVVKSLKEQELLVRNINDEVAGQLKFGDRLADKIAEFGGSWKFIISFGGIIIFWIVVNTILIATKPFDPFPFILLNLVLSCLAAIQAPVIMMSQNRQESRDRIRSENDYKTNLMAELEIRHINEKLDHLVVKQWQRLLEIQEYQTEMMNELLGFTRSKGKKHDCPPSI